jgi:hypothetical protein
MIIGIDASRALRARRTGTERYALELIRHLLALPEAGEHQWRLYTDVAVEAAHFLEGTGPARALERVVLPATRLWTHRALAAEITRRRPDVLFVPSHVLPFLPGRLPPSVAIFRRRIPVSSASIWRPAHGGTPLRPPPLLP